MTVSVTRSAVQSLSLKRVLYDRDYDRDRETASAYYDLYDRDYDRETASAGAPSPLKPKPAPYIVLDGLAPRCTRQGDGRGLYLGYNIFSLFFLFLSLFLCLCLSLSVSLSLSL